MLSQFSLLFPQACITSILAGGAAWALLWLALHFRPGLAAQRAPWLLAQLGAAAVLVLVLLPGASRFSIFPAVEPSTTAAAHVDAPVPPMLAGLLRPMLLLPRHLRDLDLDQQALVIEHELTHLSRLDQLWLHMALSLQILLWFNPALPALRRQLTCAQELGCDRAVLAGSTLRQRMRYGAALIAQFKMQQTSPAYAAMAFGGQLRDCVNARVALIRDGIAFHSHAAVRAASGCLLIALLLASVVLQPAFALRPVATSPRPVNPAAESLPQWLAPLQRMHITSYFGTVRTAGATPHGGIDLAARAGTPIMAPASGTVTASTDLYQGEARYGEVIAIEHAGGLRSVYAHLNQRSVKVGQAVAKGQLIGHTGATGRVSGPHLHLEIHRNNIKLDPELLLGSQDGTDTAKNARDTQRSR
ncbi:peptidoglycan DD-metalloendopeptidase family protein [Massilia pseudoviolaceinigra]|uniref:peptidoglycan DD-metalloendopeptidase family protein n=1 Tax=Massilia pseudoviolaceinigra TaxID=3057165 RepID=UPI00279679AE|nr:peptidoglycan DD-metalloendopeptidase family protein [Massilia sp. CCM 9206]MDQ1924809.1 peptidoglycan DD-metalloendopeptidase family protein [Massilia sp. CCM 9206]